MPLGRRVPGAGRLALGSFDERGGRLGEQARVFTRGPPLAPSRAVRTRTRLDCRPSTGIDFGHAEWERRRTRRASASARPNKARPSKAQRASQHLGQKRPPGNGAGPRRGVSLGPPPGRRATFARRDESSTLPRDEKTNPNSFALLRELARSQTSQNHLNTRMLNGTRANLPPPPPKIDAEQRGQVACKRLSCPAPACEDPQQVRGKCCPVCFSK